MKRLLFLLTVFIPFIWFMSCDDSNLKGWDAYLSTGQPLTVNISLDKYNINVNASACSELVVVTSDGGWSITSDADWCAVSKQSGSQTQTITVNIKENTAPQSRDCNLIFTTTSGNQVVLKLSQSGTGYYLSFEYTQSLHTNSSADTTDISFRTNDEWIATVNHAEWMTISPSSGNGDGQIKLILKNNNTDSEHKGQVTITGKHSGFSDTYMVTQDGKYLELSDYTVNFGAEGGTQTITVDTDGAFSVVNNCDWVTAMANSKDTIMITAEANPNNGSRPAYLIVKLDNLDSGSKIEKPITVNQKGKINFFYIDPTYIANVPSEGLSTTITIESNLSWQVIDKPSWILVSPESGENNEEVKMKIDPNNDTNLRSYDVKFKDSEGGISVVKIEQKGRQYQLEVNPTSISVAYASEKKSVNIISNDSWTVSKGQNSDWITISRESGSNNDSFDISFSENTSESPRSGTVIVTGHHTAPKTIQITQGGKQIYLVVDPTGITTDYTSVEKTVNVTSNDSWIVSKDRSWITLSMTSGSNSGSFTVSLDENTTPSLRSGSVTVTNTTSGLSTTISVQQGGKQNAPVVDPTNISAGYSSSPMTITVTSNDTWTVSKDQDWIRLSKTSGSNNGSFTVSLDENTTPSLRSGSVTVTNTTSGLSTSISVQQDGSSNIEITGYDSEDTNLDNSK